MTSRLISNIIMGIIVLLLAFLIVAILPGCYNQKKAITQHGRAVSTYPAIGADYCARTYPVTARTDSSAYKNSKAIIDSLEQQLANTETLSDQEREQLLEEIQRAKDLITGPINCDSLSEPLYRLAAKERKRGDYFEQINKKLIAAANNLKPVIDTVIDKASLDRCEIERRAETERANKEQSLHEKYQKRSRHLTYAMIGIGISGLLWLFFTFRKKIIKP